MPATDGRAGLDGMCAGEAAVEVRRGVALMKADPDTYRAMTPRSHWGNYDGQLAALERLVEGCEQVPRAIVRVSL